MKTSWQPFNADSICYKPIKKPELWDESCVPQLSCCIFTFFEYPISNSPLVLVHSIPCCCFWRDYDNYNNHHCIPFFVQIYHLSCVEQKVCNLKYIDFFLQIDKISIGSCSFFPAVHRAKKARLAHSNRHCSRMAVKLHMSFHPDV